MMRFKPRMLVHELLQFGEDETARWVPECSPDEYRRIANVAEWLLYYGPHHPSGASMSGGQCMAMAAVYVREAAPRNLKRRRRRKIPYEDTPQVSDELMKDLYVRPEGEARFYAVGEDAMEFWG